MNGRFRSQTAEFEIIEPSQVAFLRREVCSLAFQMGMPTDRQDQLAIVLTELANNLIHHAGGGGVLIRQFWLEDCCGIDILALDHGPGISDLARALGGGQSTRGGLGEGLSAVQRLADRLQISTSKTGTALLGRFWVQPPSRLAAWFPVVINRAKSGEPESGDACSAKLLPDGGLLTMVLDGLGHGPEAARVASEARQLFARSSEYRPGRLLEDLHKGLRRTRGAAAMLLRLGRDTLKVASVGNVQGVIVHEESRKSLMGYGGIVGYGAVKIREFTYDFPPGALLIAHTDGLEAGWDLRRYPGLAERDPALIAGLLQRDHRRDDDAAILAVRSGATG